MSAMQTPAAVDLCWPTRSYEIAEFSPAQTLLARMEQAEAAATMAALAQARDMASLRDLRLAQQAEALEGSSRTVAAAAAAFDETGWVATEIGMALGLSDAQVRARLDWVDALDRYPHAHALAADGAAPAWTTQRLVDQLDELAAFVSSAELAEVEAQVVEWLREGRRTVAQLNRRMRRIILRAKAQADVADNHDESAAHAERDVRVRSRGDGTADVWARLPEPDALAVAAALRATTSGARQDDDSRTVAQRRADALVAAVTGAPGLYGSLGDAPVACDIACGDDAEARVQPRIEVTIPVRTLTGQGEAPGEVRGYGVVPSVTARDLAGMPGASFHAVLFDIDTGRLVGLAPDLGRVHWVAESEPAAGYRHPPVMEAIVTARDRRCRAPGCLRAATSCDNDHVRPWPDGPTSVTNTCCLCRYHHRLKTHATGWRVACAADDDVDGLTWTTPTGRTAVTTPHDYRDDDPPPF